jgi:diaminohydroxyphosphoribosylaminopyrimidine deaminase/5-amino-6-(5-phosphoribosylamino)uracil reductase
VQELAAVIAPKLLGGVAARTPVGDLDLEAMAQVTPWHSAGRSALGADLLWRLSQLDS